MQRKELSTEHISNNTSKPDGSTHSDEINAWLALRINKRMMQDVVE
jgi:hypothetical protein